MRNYFEMTINELERLYGHTLNGPPVDCADAQLLYLVDQTILNARKEFNHIAKLFHLGDRSQTFSKRLLLPDITIEEYRSAPLPLDLKSYDLQSKEVSVLQHMVRCLSGAVLDKRLIEDKRLSVLEKCRILYMYGNGDFQDIIDKLKNIFPLGSNDFIIACIYFGIISKSKAKNIFDAIKWLSYAAGYLNIKIDNLSGDDLSALLLYLQGRVNMSIYYELVIAFAYDGDVEKATNIINFIKYRVERCRVKALVFLLKVLHNISQINGLHGTYFIITTDEYDSVADCLKEIINLQFDNQFLSSKLIQVAKSINEEFGHTLEERLQAA